MKRILGILVLSLLMSMSANASKFSAKIGDTVENEISFGKIKFPLPPGEFTVATYKKWLMFKDIMLVQIDKDTGIVRWKIKFTATGNTNTKHSSWVQSEMCKKKNLYFLKVKKGSQKFACWSVSHSSSNGEEITRSAISNNYFSFGDKVYYKIGANEGISEKVREFENQNNIKLPDMFVVSKHHYAKKARLYESEYYYNPELDGIPKSNNLNWDRNEFHKQQIRNFPKHEAFMKDYISISASLIDRFNKLNRVKGNLMLDASTYVTQVSTNSQNNGTKETNNENKGDLINQIKSLKELLDAGAITQDEFDKAKKKILN
ncbi:SHOCT domain-containing protein [Candidatus Pelagibacter sp.]|nr:SHOCT domain-containing protein [Candidatus Pelagibacter sp.]